MTTQAVGCGEAGSGTATAGPEDDGIGATSSEIGPDVAGTSTRWSASIIAFADS